MAKGSIDIDNLNASIERFVTWLCMVAGALPGTGDSIAIANYMGGTNEFDGAIAFTPPSHAEQNDEDHAGLQKSSNPATSHVKG